MDSKDIWLNKTNSTLSPIKLDRLHYFLFCLKQNGIYANINLHVGREYPEMLSNKTLLSAFIFVFLKIFELSFWVVNLKGSITINFKVSSSL